MKINNRKELKEILETNISNEEKKNKIAELKNIKTHAMRVIEVDNELDLKVGQIWKDEKATSWSDTNKEGSEFRVENSKEVQYLLEVEDVEGYEVQYFEKGISDEEDDLAFDEVYEEVMNLLGSDGDMGDEREVLVPADTKMKIVDMSDERDETGYIYIKLKTI